MPPQWEYGGEAKDGPREECIPLQLQRLFASLQLTGRAAVDTRALTTSFGWTSAQAFRQHDVQELCRVLFDALEAGTGDPHFINALFRAEVADCVTCGGCGAARSRVDPVVSSCVCVCVCVCVCMFKLVCGVRTRE